MCGICGVVGADEPDRLARMMAALRHRGPDETGRYRDERASIGMTRLAIVDRLGGHQPFFSEDGGMLGVVNGEIYNHVSLRRDLRGHRFQTLSDSECVVHLAEEGVDRLAALEGQYAFAVWDGGRLVLGRDPVGIKPLYYAPVEDRLYFASELKALLLELEAPEVSPEGLDLYLGLRYVPAPWTIVDEVYQLPPGHILFWEDGDFAVRRLVNPWRPGPAVPLRQGLEAAVKDRLMGEVPIGVFLSGGIDSSLIASLAWMYKDDLKGYVARMDLEGEGLGEHAESDESAFAREVADALGMDLAEVPITDAVFDRWPEVVEAMDAPVADSAGLATVELARRARRDVTVVLTGEGADELFAGYGYYSRVLQRTHGISAFYGRMLDWLRLPHPAAKAFAREVCVFPNRRTLRVLGDAFRGLREHLDRENAVMGINYVYWLPDDLLTKLDRCTMAHSLEGRVPYLDRRVIGYALSLPAREKINSDKAHLRRIAKGIVPRRIRSRPKHGFNLPRTRWLRERPDLVEDLVLSDRSAAARGFVSKETARSLVAGMVRPQEVVDRLWSLMHLELWMRRFMDDRRG